MLGGGKVGDEKGHDAEFICVPQDNGGSGGR